MSATFLSIKLYAVCLRLIGIAEVTNLVNEVRLVYQDPLAWSR